MTLIAAENCHASHAHLGLPPVDAGVPIAQRRQVFMDYLGSGMRAEDSFFYRGWHQLAEEYFSTVTLHSSLMNYSSLMPGYLYSHG